MNPSAIGYRFNHWTIIDGPIIKPNRSKNWLCRCDCGHEGEVSQYRLENDKAFSCGCSKEVSEHTKVLLKEKSTGQTRSEEAKAKISAANKGRVKPEGWTPWTPERLARQEQKVLLRRTGKHLQNKSS